MRPPCEVPPAEQVAELRTPTAEVVLGEFRAQRGGAAAAAPVLAEAAATMLAPGCEAAQAPSRPESLAEDEPLDTPRSGDRVGLNSAGAALAVVACLPAHASLPADR